MISSRGEKGCKEVGIRGTAIYLLLWALVYFFLLSSSSFAADSFIATTLGDYGNVTVMEVSGDYDANNADGSLNSTPRQEIAKEFFRLHKDEYDFLVVFSNFGFTMPGSEANAFYLHVKNDTQGIGRSLFDYSADFGSDGKLQGIVDMGNIAKLVTDPFDPKFETSLSILGHEILHRWGSYVKFRDWNGNTSSMLLGKNGDHWSYLFNTYGSLLYGNYWQENADGTFTSIASEKYYSPLDLYLMGLADKTHVSPMLLIENSDIDPEKSPESGATITGVRHSVSIDDIISVEGERIPGPAESQKAFKTAFILITTPGTFTGGELFGLENLRNAFVTRFSILTDGNGIMSIAASPIEGVPANPGVPPPPVNPRDLPPDINDGVVWLMSNQQADGSWMDSGLTIGRDTPESVFVLQNFDFAEQSYTAGLQWLETNTFENTDGLCRNLSAYAKARLEASPVVSKLLSRQNPDGGWGSAEGYLSNATDTAAALRSLSDVGDVDETAIAKAVGYLKAAQNPDGGWGGEDSLSMNEETANALTAFNAYKSAYDLDGHLSKGVSWMTERQNPDGGFGNSPSTVYDTALAVLTLSEFDVQDEVEGNALDYLLGLQSEDGSWHESPYQTALAINAVWKASYDPDLSVKREDITIIPSVIRSLPQDAVINVNVFNLGRTDVPQATVRLYDGDPAPGNIAGEQTLSFAGNSSSAVTFLVTIPDGNEHRFYVYVDPDDQVDESNESNNVALHILFPESTYDLEVISLDITVIPNPAEVFQDVTITSKITNKGTMNAYNVQVKYYIDVNGTPFDIATSTVDVPANGTITDEIVWRANKAGDNMILTVFADAFDSFAELSEDNNKATIFMTINKEDLTDPNLTISYKDIVIMPDPVNQGESVTISALVKNEGFSVAADIKVDFYKGTPGVDGQLLGTQMISSLAPGENSTVNIDWNNIDVSGEKVVYVQVDPENLIREIRDDDNDAFSTIKILCRPDLEISSNSIVFSPPAPKEGDTVGIYCTIKNTGDQEASDVIVRVYEADILLGSEVIPLLAGNSQTVISFEFETIGQLGMHEIVIIVDPDNEVIERREDNNQASKILRVQNIDQSLTEQYISPNGDGVKDSTQFFFRLNSPQTVKIVIVDKDDQAVRTFSGNEFANTAGGSVTWDGLNDDGMVVDDGQCGIQLKDIDNRIISGIFVIVDNNRSSLTEAIGTKYLMKKDLECWNTNWLRSVFQWVGGLDYQGGSPGNVNSMWLPDDRGIIFSFSSGHVGPYSPGLYILSPDGTNVEEILPDGWTTERYIFDIRLSPDGKKVILRTSYDWLTEIWVLNITSRNLVRIDFRDSRTSHSYISSNIYKLNQQNTFISYEIMDTSNKFSSPELWVSDAEGFDKMKITSIDNTNKWYGEGIYTIWHSWSPDGQRIFYIDREWSVWVSDTSGNDPKKILSGTKDYPLSSYNSDNLIWLDNRFVAAFDLSPLVWDAMLVVDTITGDKKTLGLPVYPFGKRKWYETQFWPIWTNSFNVAADKKKFASWGSLSGQTSVIISDFEGNYTLLSYDLDISEISPTLRWSPDGRWLAVLYAKRPATSDEYHNDQQVFLSIVDTFSDNYRKDIRIWRGNKNEVDSLDVNIMRHPLIEWFPDSRHLKFHSKTEKTGPYAYYHTYVMDVLSDRMLPLDDWYYGEPTMFSPGGNFITGLKWTLGCTEEDLTDAFDENGYQIRRPSGVQHRWLVGSLLNLTSILNASVSRDGVKLSGVAIDLNFDRFTLEYADINYPNDWKLIMPPSYDPVSDDIFALWVPPAQGTYYVKLTVWDKAGNEARSLKRISWGEFSNITNFHMTNGIFSPNGDGNKDTFELGYTVHDSTHLEFDIYDIDDNLIRSINEDHAAPGEYSITWDGRIDSGSVVPDGQYKVKVLTFEFPIEVDNSPPTVNIRVGSIEQDSQAIGLGLYFNIEGYAVDERMKYWVLEIGEGENPQEWTEIQRGEDILVAKSSEGIPILNPIENALISRKWDMEIKSHVSKKLRLMAEDVAGNISSVISDFIEERIILNSHQIANYPAQGNYYIEDIPLYDPEKLYPALAVPGTHIFIGLETVRAPLQSLTIQYQNNKQWYDSDTSINSMSGQMNLEWDSSALDLSSLTAVRLKAVDILGQDYYSNTIMVKEEFRIICDGFAKSSLFEDLMILKLRVHSNQDTSFDKWTDYWNYDSSKGDPIPTGTFQVAPQPFMKEGMTYDLQLYGVGASGKTYTSEVVKYPGSCIAPLIFSLDISHEETSCNSISHKAKINIKIESMGSSLLNTLSYYLDGPDGSQLLKEFNLAEFGWPTTELELDTSALPEGKYPIRAIFKGTSFAGGIPKDFTAAETNTLIVNRILPTSQIVYPSGAVMICPSFFEDSKGTWPGIPIEGIATDNAGVKRYEINYSNSDFPDAWINALTRLAGEAFPLSVSGARQGILGNWNLENISDSDLSLRLKVTDISGNVACHVTDFFLDHIFNIGDIELNSAFLSPNSDGSQDNVNLTYDVDENSTLDIEIHDLNQTGNTENIAEPAIRTLLSDFAHPGGQDYVEWDGRNDSGTVVPDGTYAIVVFGEDTCGNGKMKWAKVEVDNTPPEAVITYPLSSDQVGNTVEISATADDLNLVNYVLDAGQGDNPEDWLIVSSGTAPVRDGVIGVWNNYGLEGRWTLRLTAVDAAGNISTSMSTIDIGSRKNLITAFSSSPKFISPNDDGCNDYSMMNYTLSETCDVTLDVIDSTGSVRKEYLSSHSVSGAYSETWDGRDEPGMKVSDGTYALRLHASLSSDASVTQNETLTVIIDSTPPYVDIKQPLAGTFAQGPVTVYGTISDENLLAYSLAYSSDNGSVLIEEGNQKRKNHTFGVTINDISEGNYSLDARVKDLADNMTEVVIPFTIDRTPPKVVLDAPKDGEYYGSQKSSISINGSIVEKNLEKYTLRYGPGENPSQWMELYDNATTPVEPQLFVWNVGKTSAMSDGLYTLSFYAKDKAGLISEARARIIVDNTSPEVSITDPNEDVYIKAPTVIYGTAYDANLDKYTLELSEGQCSTAFKWGVIKTSTLSVTDGVIVSWQTLPPDGNYCLRLTATDKLGNKKENGINVKVDTHPPAAPVLSGKIENKENASLIWTQNPEPDITGHDLYRNGQKINTSLLNGTAYIDQNLDEGVYTYTVETIDFAGNESPLSNEVKLKVDETGPDVKISSPKDCSSVSGIVDIRGTAFSSEDFKHYRVYIEQGQNPTIWNLIRTSPLPIPYGTLTQWNTLGLNGVYSIKLEAEDLTGNISSHQISVVVDDLPPATPVLNSVIASGADVTLAWQANAEPDLAGYLVFRNNQIVNAPAAGIGDINPYLIKYAAYVDMVLPDGIFQYYLIAVDQAGNMSNPSNTIEVNIDNHPPHANIVEPSDKAKFDTRTLAKAESADIDIASVQFQYKKTLEFAWNNLGNPVTQKPYIVYLDPAALGLTYGDYQLRAVGTDQGGKTDAAPSYITLTYTDLAAPQAPANLEALTDGKDVTLTWSTNAEMDLNGYNIYRTSGSTRTKIVSITKETTYRNKGLSDGTYTYEITAVDTFGNESKPSDGASAKIYAPALERPYTPTGEEILQILGSNAEADSTVEVYVETTTGSELRGTTTADATGNFVVSVTLSSDENKMMAKAKDNAGNVSRASNMVAVIYSQRPAPPTGLSSAVQDHNVSLTWNPNSEPDLAGYNLYRDGEQINTPVMVTSGNVAASSYYSYNYASKAFDKDPSTFWMSYYGYTTFIPQWWEIDLPSAELIRHMEINWFNYSNTLYAGRDYEIQVWSGYSWITLAKVNDNNEKDNFFDFNPSYRTNKIRIYITDSTYEGNYKIVRISEIKILKDDLITQTSYSEFNLQDSEYKYEATAVNYNSLESLPSDEASAVVGDVVPPSAPQNLTATASGMNVTLSWIPNTEPDLAGYNVYQNTPAGWSKLNNSLVSAPAYIDSSLANGTYTYRVTAIDVLGNGSDPSNEAVASVAIATLPSPVNLHATSMQKGSSLNLSWEYSSGSASGYNLYRSATSGGPYVKVNISLIFSLSYTDSGLINGNAYFYVVTAVDSVGNESDYSDEAMGIPSDDSPPDKPYILFPTMPGSPIILYNSKADVSGIAEPGSTIDLFKNGVPIENIVTNEEDTHSSFSMESDIMNPSLSPDGKVLAYSKSGSLWLKTIADGNAEEITQQADLPVWSSGGDKLAYQFMDNNGYYRIGVYDIDKGTSELLTTDAYVQEQFPSWTGDGSRIAFTSTKGGYRNVWIKDLSSTAATRLTWGNYITNPKISPDGKQLAFFINQNLYTLNISDSTYYRVDTQADTSSLEWSPDSKQIAFASNRNGHINIFVFDIGTKNQKQITDSLSSDTDPVWSPNGQSIAFRVLENNSYSISVASSSGLGQNGLLQQNLGSADNLSWVRSGGIAYKGQNTMNIIYPVGHFSFKDVQLDTAENVFYAVTTDEAGNASEPSDPISVIFDASMMPDIEILDSDISFYPPVALPVQPVTITISVRNKGKVDAKDISVDTYAMDGSGSMEMVDSAIIDSLPSGSEQTFSLVWPGSSKVGSNTVIAVVDSTDTIHEIDETNNIVTKEMFVVGDENVILSANLNAKEYRSNEFVNIYLKLDNPGPEKDVTVETFIEDEGGGLVTALGSINANISYGHHEEFSLKWNTAGTYAGPYRLRTVLHDGGNVSEKIVGFTVLPDMDVGSEITTDKTNYGSGENVSVKIQITNLGQNYIIPELLFKVRITDVAGSVLYSEDISTKGLLPGGVANSSCTWNTGSSTPGDYVISVDTYVGDQLIESESISITIDPVVAISGQVKVAPAAVNQGDTVTVDYNVHNSGNTDASNVTTNVIVLDAESQQIVANYEETVSIDMGDELSRQFTFSTNEFEIKTYSVALQYTYLEKTEVIAGASVTVKDGLPPQVVVTSPVGGNCYNAAININAFVTDNTSGVNKVEYSIDEGSWAPMTLKDPSTGRYSSVWGLDSEEGERSVAVRASDKAGNMSAPVQVVFNVDLTPPHAPAVISLPNNSVSKTDIIDIEGTAEPGSNVEFTFAGTVAHSATAHADPISGRFLFSSIDLKAGDNLMTLYATNSCGNSGETLEYNLRLDIGDWVSGVVSVDADTVYQGRDVTITYSIFNAFDEYITDLKIKLYILDPGTSGAKEIFETSAEAPMKSNINGDHIFNTLNLSPQIYQAVLEVSSDSFMRPKVLSTATFEVKPALEISKTIADIEHVLIWLNYKCVNDESQSNCLESGSIEDKLAEAGIFYHIVQDKKDFEKELRNPLYTDFMVLGDHNPIEDHFSEELKEQVYSGKGMISSLFNRQNLDEEVFGMRYLGHLPSQDFPVTFLESGISSGGDRRSSGIAQKIEAVSPEEVAGWIQEDTDKGAQTYPAIILRKLGRGKAVYFSFDLGSSSHEVPFADLMKDSLIYVHSSRTDPADESFSWHAKQFCPIKLTITSLGSAFNLKITENYPREIALYDSSADQWIDENPWVISDHLEPFGSRSVLYYALAPDIEGLYSFDTEVGYMEDGKYNLYQDLRLEAAVSSDPVRMYDGITVDLNSLPLSGQEKAKAENALKYIDKVRSRVCVSEDDIEKNIDDVMKAIDSLSYIKSLDVAVLRNTMDNLLIFWEAKWYFISQP
jgi:Tol biopolymer transport system component/subtilase family serine protease